MAKEWTQLAVDSSVPDPKQSEPGWLTRIHLGSEAPGDG